MISVLLLTLKSLSMVLFGVFFFSSSFFCAAIYFDSVRKYAAKPTEWYQSMLNALFWRCFVMNLHRDPPHTRAAFWEMFCLFFEFNLYGIKYYIWLMRGEMLIIVKYCPQTMPKTRAHHSIEVKRKNKIVNNTMWNSVEKSIRECERAREHDHEQRGWAVRIHISAKDEGLLLLSANVALIKCFIIAVDMSFFLVEPYQNHSLRDTMAF